MIKYSVIGTSWITESFIDGASLVKELVLDGVYSRSIEKGEEFKNKTGALLKASILGGYSLAGADKRYFPVLEKFSHILGILFQLKDDILDVTSTQDELGKPILSDEKNNKMTFVSEYGIEKCIALLEEYKNEAIWLLEKLPYNTEFLKEITNYTADSKN